MAWLHGQDSNLRLSSVNSRVPFRLATVQCGGQSLVQHATSDHLCVRREHAIEIASQVLSVCQRSHVPAHEDVADPGVGFAPTPTGSEPAILLLDHPGMDGVGPQGIEP